MTYHGRDFENRKFAKHVELSSDVFWMRENFLQENLVFLEKKLSLKYVEECLDGNSYQDDSGREFSSQKIFEICRRMIQDVYRACDHYLVSYYDLILAWDMRQDEDRDHSGGGARDVEISEDRARRTAHITVTTNIAILARNLKRWNIPVGVLEEYAINDHYEDSKRTEIGNLALHLAFSRYLNA